MNQSTITYQDKLDELRFDIPHPKNNGMNFICVEGQSDIKLFRKLFDGKTCKVEHIPGGNEKVEDCVAALMSFSPLVIGIRDADFIRLSTEAYSKPNMFLTDNHDIEMMMLAQPSITHALLNEYDESGLDESQANVFLQDVMTAIMRVSCLKWLNCKEDLGLACSKTAFIYLIDLNTLTLDFDTYWQRLLDKSVNAQLPDKHIIDQQLDELCATSPDLWQMTNGHDLVAILAEYFKTIHGIKAVSPQNIDSTLRVAYTNAHFQQTELYQQLQHWAASNQTSIVS